MMRTAAAAFAALILVVVAWIPIRNYHPATQTKPARRTLRVCADPNNLPFSNQLQEGFENQIAFILAHELHAELEYTWWAQRRGFIRNTLNSGTCDIVLGVPASMDLLLVTAPYYRSTYVFVYRTDRGLSITSFDSPELRQLRIGVQLVGDDYANTPPAHALAKRGIVQNIRGYSIIDDYSKPNPPARIIEAVANGDIDVAIAWGPMAGYFATRQSVPLEVRPVSPAIDAPALPFVFDISIGVRRGEQAFRNEIERAVEKNRLRIHQVLARFGVPQLPLEEGT
jgi:quinoprotein dehydrogenase-associated probable ABC transporter substrate-binding protein